LSSDQKQYYGNKLEKECSLFFYYTALVRKTTGDCHEEKQIDKKHEE